MFELSLLFFTAFPLIMIFFMRKTIRFHAKFMLGDKKAFVKFNITKPPMSIDELDSVKKSVVNAMNSHINNARLQIFKSITVVLLNTSSPLVAEYVFSFGQEHIDVVSNVSGFIDNFLILLPSFFIFATLFSKAFLINSLAEFDDATQDQGQAITKAINNVPYDKEYLKTTVQQYIDSVNEKNRKINIAEADCLLEYLRKETVYSLDKERNNNGDDGVFLA